jgi:hypothetical protein
VSKWKKRERATERHRDLPGFYPSVEPRSRLAMKVGDETGLLSDQTSHARLRGDRNPSDPKMMQIASHLSVGCRARFVPAGDAKRLWCGSSMWAGDCGRRPRAHCGQERHPGARSVWARCAPSRGSGTRIKREWDASRPLFRRAAWWYGHCVRCGLTNLMRLLMSFAARLRRTLYVMLSARFIELQRRPGSLVYVRQRGDGGG